MTQRERLKRKETVRKGWWKEWRKWEEKIRWEGGKDTPAFFSSVWNPPSQPPFLENCGHSWVYSLLLCLFLQMKRRKRVFTVPKMLNSGCKFLFDFFLLLEKKAKQKERRTLHTPPFTTSKSNIIRLWTWKLCLQVNVQGLGWQLKTVTRKGRALQIQLK